MGRHDDLLAQGAREAPEPETAEQRSKRLGMGAAAGGAVAVGAAALKFGGVWKFLLWLLAIHSISDGWRIGGWIAVAVVLVGLGLAVFLRSQPEEPVVQAIPGPQAEIEVRAAQAEEARRDAVADHWRGR